MRTRSVGQAELQNGSQVGAASEQSPRQSPGLNMPGDLSGCVEGARVAKCAVLNFILPNFSP